jgi:hypothetical protein
VFGAAKKQEGDAGNRWHRPLCLLLFRVYFWFAFLFCRGFFSGRFFAARLFKGACFQATDSEARPTGFPSNGLPGKPASLQVDRAGIEPATHGFSVRCSTN